MNKTLILCFLLVLSGHFLQAQLLSGKIIDKNTKEPVPYATVQLSDNSGVISNEEGYFTIDLGNTLAPSLRVSCLGYTQTILSIDAFRKANNIIALEESALQLNEVFVSNKTPNADAIIAKVRAKVLENYGVGPLTHELFYRESAYIDFAHLNLEVQRASHVEKDQIRGANLSLDSLANTIVNSKAVHFTDFKGDLHVKDRENLKLSVDKATRLIDSKRDFSIENVQKKAQDIVLKYLDTTKTYKLKTGLFKIEDSLSLNDESGDDKNEYTISYLKSDTDEVLKTSQLYDGSFLNRVLDAKYYSYSFLDATFFNDELIYIIQFTPKRAKAKFTGKLYISDDTYAVIKTDYRYGKGKRGQKVNLKLILGVKYIENARTGTIMYKKREDNTYVPHYIKREEGSYFYVNRPFKFIENSEEKNKVAFDLKLEGDARNKEELLFITHSDLSSLAYDAFEEKEKTPYQVLSKYDPTIWQNSKVITPLEEMKSFGNPE